MPIFEYECNECKEVFEKLVKPRKDLIAFCPKCNSRATKIMSAGIFRGEKAEPTPMQRAEAQQKSYQDRGLL